MYNLLTLNLCYTVLPMLDYESFFYSCCWTKIKVLSSERTKQHLLICCNYCKCKHHCEILMYSILRIYFRVYNCAMLSLIHSHYGWTWKIVWSTIKSNKIGRWCYFLFLFFFPLQSQTNTKNTHTGMRTRKLQRNYDLCSFKWGIDCYFF